MKEKASAVQWMRHNNNNNDTFMHAKWLKLQVYKNTCVLYANKWQPKKIDLNAL